jgi:hypothetical protein
MDTHKTHYTTELGVIGRVARLCRGILATRQFSPRFLGTRTIGRTTASKWVITKG